LTFVLGSIRSEFGLSAAQTGLLSSMSFAGMFLGAAIAGIAADRYGRTLVFQVSMIFWGACGLAGGLASSVTALGAARALLGFGMGMEFPVAQSIVSEMIPARLCGRYLALLEGFWPLGFIAAGLLARAVLPLGGWRWVFIIEAIPALFVFAVRFLVPESPRWLAVRSRMAAAEAVMQKFETAVSARLRGGVLPEPQPQPVERTVGARFPFLELWSGQHIRRTTMVWLLWFFALLGYYGLTTWLGALLQQAGYSVTRSVYYTTLISLAGRAGLFYGGVPDRGMGPQTDVRRGTRWSRCIGVVLWHGREPDPAHRVGSRPAVLPIRHVVGPLRLHARVLSHTSAGDGRGMRIRDRPAWIVAGSLCRRKDSATRRTRWGLCP